MGLKHDVIPDRDRPPWRVKDRNVSDTRWVAVPGLLHTEIEDSGNAKPKNIRIAEMLFQV